MTSDNVSTERKQVLEENIRDFMAKRSVQGLVRVTTGPDAFQGSKDLVEAYGLGALVPNTIILGDSENSELIHEYCDMITSFYQQQRNVIVVHDNEGTGFGKRQRIDVWWGGLKGNGGLMILAYLLQSSRKWWDAKVNIKMVVDEPKAVADVQQNLTHILEKIRIDAEPEVLVSNGRSFDKVLHESSQGADLVLMGMAEPGKTDEEGFVTYYEDLHNRLTNLPTTIMVLAAEEISFGEVLMQQDTFQED